MVDRANFDRVQDLMHGRNRNSAGFGVRTFAYRGLLKCGYCGCALTAELKKSKYVYYHCTGGRGECPKPFVLEERLTDYFTSLLDDMFIPRHVVDWITSELRRERQDADVLLRQREERLNKNEARLLRRLESLYVDKADGELSSETYRSLKIKADEELAGIRRAKGSARLPSASDGLDPESLIELAATASNRFKTAEPEGKRELLSWVVSNSTYGRAGVQVCLKEPFDIVLAVHHEMAANGGENAKVEKWLPD